MYETLSSYSVRSCNSEIQLACQVWPLECQVSLTLLAKFIIPNTSVASAVVQWGMFASIWPKQLVWAGPVTSNLYRASTTWLWLNPTEQVPLYTGFINLTWLNKYPLCWGFINLTMAEPNWTGTSLLKLHQLDSGCTQLNRYTFAVTDLNTRIKELQT